MSTTQPADLFEKAMVLEPEARWSLATRILESIPVESVPEIEHYWRIEVGQRLEELRSGTVTPVPWDEAIAKMESIIGE